jgi:hypothetical protein
MFRTMLATAAYAVALAVGSAHASEVDDRIRNYCGTAGDGQWTTCRNGVVNQWNAEHEHLPSPAPQASAARGAVVPNGFLTAPNNARQIAGIIAMSQNNLNTQRCLAGLANCLSRDQFRVAAQAFADKFAKTWDVLSQQNRNCIYQVVLNPSLGSPQEACGPFTDDKAEYIEIYIRGLIDAIVDHSGR